MLTGLAALDEEDQMTFVRHVIDQNHWAGNRKRKAGSASGSKAKSAKVATKAESASKAAKGRKKSTASTANIVPGSFSVPVPGVDGAVDDENFLKGKTFVMTGVFIEVGGGDDDSVGVENLKSMIESFGGKVTTRFSKNTSEYQLVVVCYNRWRIHILCSLVLTHQSSLAPQASYWQGITPLPSVSKMQEPSRSKSSI